MTTTTQLTVPVLDEAMRKVALSQNSSDALRDAFAPHFQRAHELAQQAAQVKADEPKKARAARLALRETRIAAEQTRKSQKEDSLRLGKAIDGIYNVLEFQVAPLEKALQAIEDAEEIRERQRKEALHQQRSEELRPYLDPTHLALGEMADEAYAAVLSGAKRAHEDKLAAEARVRAEEAERLRLAEEKRLAKEKADAEERARLKAENERLEAERKKAEQARLEAEAKAKAEREAQEKVLAEERRKAAAAAEAERKKREAAEAELRRIADYQRAKAEEARLEAEAKAKAERAAREQAEAAPDKEKVAAIVAEFRAVKIPALTTAKGKALQARIDEQVQKMAAWLETEIAKL